MNFIQKWPNQNQTDCVCISCYFRIVIIDSNDFNDDDDDCYFHKVHNNTCTLWVKIQLFRHTYMGDDGNIFASDSLRNGKKTRKSIHEINKSKGLLISTTNKNQTHGMI